MRLASLHTGYYMTQKGGAGMNEEKSLAMEIAQELKTGLRRWRTAFFILAVIELATIAGFVIFK